MLKTPSLIFYSPFEIDCTDVVNADNTCSSNNVTFINSSLGKGASFSYSSGSYLSYTKNIPMTTEMTICFWGYITSFQDPTATGFLIKRTANTNGFALFYYMGTMQHDFGGSTYRWNTGYNPPLNTPFHFALVRSNSGRILYIDGLLYSSTSAAGSIIDASAPMYISKNNSTNAYYLNGKIDELLIYNTALSEIDIRRVMRGMHPFKS